MINTKYRSLGLLQPIAPNFLHSFLNSFAEAYKSHGLSNQSIDHSSYDQIFWINDSFVTEKEYLTGGQVYFGLQCEDAVQTCGLVYALFGLPGIRE